MIGLKKIVVVDDGSGAEYANIFDKAKRVGCVVEHHGRNLGKGAAIKTAIRTAIRFYGRQTGYITADADGQHLPKDILRVAEVMELHPDTMILGIRDFSSGNVPLRSLLGNRITSAFFRLTSGIVCPDTQTGLRGIPAYLTDLALSEKGDRYEYEMNFLTDAARMVPLEFVPVETVYEDNNRASHFRPVADSLRVYGRFLRFVLASLQGAAVDYLFFYLLTLALALPQVQTIFLATVLARIGSGMVNFLMNRYWSFQSRKPVGGEMFRYFLLFLCQMCASAGLVFLLSMLPIPVIAAKLIVDTVLFFLSYRIQKNWVFKREVTDYEKQGR